MAFKLRSWRTALMAGCAGVALGVALPAAAAAEGQAREYSIASQELDAALRAFAMASGHDVVFDPALVEGRTTAGVKGEISDEEALRTLLQGTDLAFEQTASGGFVVRAPRFRAVEAEADGGTVEALIVTAQKREEDIQDVPIAISAFSQEDLTRSQVAGGPDLMTQVPNFTFTKTNFTGYSVQIRGIGTQAISATVDPAVAIAFNNTPFVRNRFFEQEFYDLQRIEVLRGPQGTLYGRNATAGVVNLISAKPSFNYEAKLSGDIGNYSSTRLEGMINIPLVEDKVALRLAGAWTKRDGYATNQLTGNPIDGRDLWSTRATLRLEPNDRFTAILLWEHFEENDDRLRSGKQVCKKDPGPSVIAGLPVPDEGGDTFAATSYLSQGCLPASMYAAESFQTPNGYALPFYGPTGNLGNAVFNTDPYISATQSRDLRVIESMVDPQYRAKTDTAELQLRYELTDTLTLDSETAYAADTVFSMQDYNRFNTKPGAFDPNNTTRPGVVDATGVFCDPQIGCTDRLMLLDLSTAKSRHFSQEFRLSSDFAGALNFSLGANFLRYDTEDKFYVFVNSLSMFAAQRWGFTQDPYVGGVTDNSECLTAPGRPGDPRASYGITGCIYIDPNPIGSLNDQGRNYFLSKNPYRLISYAAFGEVYYDVAENLKLTGGLRWTVDKKHAPLVPSWLLAEDASGDYQAAEIVDQEWQEPTGRLTIDWKPDVALTDETLLYASYAHGYKAGGANPPPPVVATYGEFDATTVLALQSHPKTFDAEFVDAFEFGTKNTLLDGRMTLNLGAFYYDYQGYQISQIVNRSAVNLNFDAEVWGLEIETDWRPMENLRLGFKGGYQNTRLADGSGAVDMMDRTDGRDDWVLVKPFPTIPSNCILPAYVVTQGGVFNVRPSYFNSSPSGICVDAYYRGLDPLTQLPYEENPTEQRDTSSPTGRGPLRDEYLGYIGFDPKSAPNGGAGFTKDLSGNELPNAPNFTATITADYTIPLPNDWLATLHTDFYYQSEAWTRVFNTEGYDKLKAYTNVNLAAIFTNEDAGWKVMAYVKNVFDRDSITGAFLNSDDTGLTTNVFLTEPRLYGLRVTKEWNGEPILGGLLNRRQREPGEAYPFTVEIGGQVQRHDAPNEVLRPAFVSHFDTLAYPLGAQEEELDWGDGREVKLTYRPGGDWVVMAAARRGETNGRTNAYVRDYQPGGFETTEDNFIFNRYIEHPGNYGTVDFRESEEHEVVDFTVGRDLGLGVKSTLSVGLRYAELTSDSRGKLYGLSDLEFTPENLVKYPQEFYRHRGDVSESRSFEGAGPVVTWEGAFPLFDAGDSGQVALAWDVAGGVLFGRQKADVTVELVSDHYRAKYVLPIAEKPTPIDTAPVSIRRQASASTTVPTFGASLGLSYEVGGVKVSGGYRWERYFDAIDGGVSKRREYDRTIDGPFFKLAVGFGG